MVESITPDPVRVTPRGWEFGVLQPCLLENQAQVFHAHLWASEVRCRYQGALLGQTLLMLRREGEREREQNLQKSGLPNSGKNLTSMKFHFPCSPICRSSCPLWASGPPKVLPAQRDHIPTRRDLQCAGAGPHPPVQPVCPL